MTTQTINPWTWQDNFGYAQAVQIDRPATVVVCAGQASIDADGHVVGVGDIRLQVATSLDNLETVLHDAGCALADVVKLQLFTTDVDSLLANYDIIIDRLSAAGCRPASTLVGVSRLAFLEMLVELEATVIR